MVQLNTFIINSRRKIQYFLKYIFYSVFAPNSFQANINKWFLIDGDSNILLNLKIDSNSIIFEVGGYVGNYSQQLAQKYNPNMVIFEPVPSFFRELRKRFSSNPKVKLFNYGLLNESRKIDITLSNDGSSIYRNEGEKLTIEIRDAHNVLVELNVQTIDLMIINIEGAEFELLPRLIEMGWLDKINLLQVQFHDFVDNAKNRRKKIINEILKTHKPTFSFPFVWEGFEKR